LFNMKCALIAGVALAVLAVVYADTCSTDAKQAAAIAVRQEHCPPSAPFFGFMGCAAALVFACLGAAYGTAKSGVGVANMGVLHAEMVMKSIIPVIMAGVLGIYGLIVAVLLASGIKGEAYGYASFSGYAGLSAGLCCGMAGLSAGIAIGIVGDAGVRANARQPKLFVGVILILIFAEALGLYGLIVALILSSKKLDCAGIADKSCFSAAK
jgi:V-type H+-transporting ATPase proteolipid subunit